MALNTLPQNVDKANLVLAINQLIRSYNAGSRSYPVDALFLHTVEADPAEVLGYGTWERYGKGRMLVGVDEDQTEFDTVGKIGGQKDVQAHSHTFGVGDDANVGSAGGLFPTDNNIGGTRSSSVAGSGTNNMNPYITVYIWRRIS